MLWSKDETGTSYIFFMGRKAVHVVFQLSLCQAVIGSPEDSEAENSTNALIRRYQSNTWVGRGTMRINYLAQEHKDVTPA